MDVTKLTPDQIEALASIGLILPIYWALRKLTKKLEWKDYNDRQKGNSSDKDQ